LARRTHALLLLEQRHPYTQAAQLVGLTERNLRKWAKRFQELGISKVFEKPRPGRTPTYTCKAGQHASTRRGDDMRIRCDTP